MYFTWGLIDFRVVADNYAEVCGPAKEGYFPCELPMVEFIDFYSEIKHMSLHRHYTRFSNALEEYSDELEKQK